MILTCEHCMQEYESIRRARKYCSKACANKANGSRRADNHADGLQPVSVWSCGGGVQSTAIAVLIETGRLPKPDYGVMVDCGYEKSATLDYMHSVTIPRMQVAGVDFRMLDTTLYTDNNLINPQGYINIPAYRLKADGRVSKLHTHCNHTWKVRVTRQWARSEGVKLMDNWIGISTDEQQREKRSTLKWINYIHPLIDLGLSREDCIYEIAKAGWPMPPRSSCVFCPMQDARAWSTVMETERDRELALEAENIIRQVDPNVYLHSSCKPLEEVFAELGNSFGNS